MERFIEAYGMLGPIAGLGQALYLAVAFWLGARLIGLSRRTRGLPEFLLGLHLLLALGVGYALLSTGVAIAELSPDPPRNLIAPLIGAGYAITICGLIATLVFTWRVFRPGDRSAAILVSATSLALFVGFAVHGLTGGFARGTFEGRAVWLLLGAMLATNGWIAYEPLKYYGQLRRRIPLGLADPLVADRMLLWGLGSLARVALVLLGPLSEFAMRHLGSGARGTVATATLLTATLLGLAVGVAFGQSFAPPPAYVRFVEARYRLPAA